MGSPRRNTEINSDKSTKFPSKKPRHYHKDAKCISTRCRNRDGPISHGGDFHFHPRAASPDDREARLVGAWPYAARLAVSTRRRRRWPECRRTESESWPRDPADDLRPDRLDEIHQWRTSPMGWTFTTPVSGDLQPFPFFAKELTDLVVCVYSLYLPNCKLEKKNIEKNIGAFEISFQYH